MDVRAEYLEIHEKAYRQLLSDGKESWSDHEDLEERISFYRTTLKLKEVAKNSKILVLGCGDGETSLALASHDYLVTGVDISPTAIRWANEKAEKRKIDCTFSVENIVESTSPSAPFDVIIDDHCLHCIVGPDRRLAFKHIHSMLKPNGFFMMRTQCGDPPDGCSASFLEMWDPDSRCQVHNGVAGRYFGLPEAILSELNDVHLRISESKVFTYPNGWSMLQVVTHGRD